MAPNTASSISMAFGGRLALKEINPLKKPKCDCYTEFDREGCSEECWHFINSESALRTLFVKKYVFYGIFFDVGKHQIYKSNLSEYIITADIENNELINLEIV